MAVTTSVDMRHRARRGSWTDPTAMSELMQEGERPFVLYTDPPWDNMKFWTTLNRKATGEDLEPATQEQLLQAITGAAMAVTHYALIEYGTRWRDRIQQIGRDAGLESHGIVGTVYSSKKLPMDLHLFAVPGVTYPDGYAQGIEGTHGYNTVKSALGPIARKDAIVLDPCCGCGYTARACKDFGMLFRGNELVQPRLDKTLAIMSR